MLDVDGDIFAPLGVSLSLRRIDWVPGDQGEPIRGTSSTTGDHRRALVAEWEPNWRSSSWALHGGGFTVARRYVCAEVRNADLPLGVPPSVVVRRFLESLALEDAVVTLTSANVAAYATALAREDDVMAAVLVTAGLANALRVGEPCEGGPRRYLPDTINLVCWLDAPLTLPAQLEAHSIMTQARTLEVLEARVPSLDRNGWATGTGTDCLTLFTPEGSGEPAAYAGMHTNIGRALGRAVRHATAKVVAHWKDAKARAELVIQK